MDAEGPTNTDSIGKGYKRGLWIISYAWGGTGSSTCSSPGCCFCCLVPTGWSHKDSPKELLLLHSKAFKRKRKRNINDGWPLYDPLPPPSVSPKTYIHRVIWFFSCTETSADKNSKKYIKGKKNPISKAARLTAGGISSWQQTKGISLNLKKPSISISKAVLYLCTFWIVLVRHIVPENGCKSTTLSTCS